MGYQHFYNRPTLGDTESESEEEEKESEDSSADHSDDDSEDRQSNAEPKRTGAYTNHKRQIGQGQGNAESSKRSKPGAGYEGQDPSKSVTAWALNKPVHAQFPPPTMCGQPARPYSGTTTRPYQSAYNSGGYQPPPLPPVNKGMYAKKVQAPRMVKDQQSSRKVANAPATPQIANTQTATAPPFQNAAADQQVFPNNMPSQVNPNQQLLNLISAHLMQFQFGMNQPQGPNHTQPQHGPNQPQWPNHSQPPNQPQWPNHSQPPNQPQWPNLTQPQFGPSQLQWPNLTQPQSGPSQPQCPDPTQSKWPNYKPFQFRDQGAQAEGLPACDSRPTANTTSDGQVSKLPDDRNASDVLNAQETPNIQPPWFNPAQFSGQIPQVSPSAPFQGVPPGMHVMGSGITINIGSFNNVFQFMDPRNSLEPSKNGGTPPS